MHEEIGNPDRPEKRPDTGRVVLGEGLAVLRQGYKTRIVPRNFQSMVE